MSTPCRCHEAATAPSGGGVFAESPPTAVDAGESPAHPGYEDPVADYGSAVGAEAAVGLPLAHESPEQSTVRLAIAGGTRDVTTLTNRVFFTRHPERNGQGLSPSDPGFAALGAEWTAIRDTVVRPLVAANPAMPPAAGTTGLWVPGAERLANSKSAGGTYVDAPWRFVFHTIEGEPSAQGFRTLAAAHANPPHLWAMPSADLLLQTIPLDRSAYALARPGSVQTNRAHAVQVECWGFAAKMGGATSETLGWLADRVLGPVARLVPIDLDQVRPAGPGESCYGEKSSCRMAAGEWQAFGGVCGHKDVPDNAHWDPGQLPMAAIAARAKATLGGTSYIQRERLLGDHDGPGFAAEHDDYPESWPLEAYDGNGREVWTEPSGEQYDSDRPPMAWVPFEEVSPQPRPPASASPFVLPAPAGAPMSGQVRETPWALEFESLTTDEIRWVQTTLNRATGAGLAVDGLFGPLTRAAVMTFQRREGLVVDGIVGPITTAALQRMAGGRPYVPSPPARSTAGPSSDPRSTCPKAAALVPSSGIYLGVSPDWEAEQLSTYAGRLGQAPAVAGTFVDFPLSAEGGGNLDAAVEQVKRNGGLLLLTLQPQTGLDKVTGTVAEELADRLNRYNQTGVPVIVRFAHEMNGSWYAWGQKASYVSAFRCVAEAVHVRAPGSATMWAPNYGGGYPFSGGPHAAQPFSDDARRLSTKGGDSLTAQDDPYSPYWPGDDAVDWVGITLYHWGSAPPWGENEVPEPGKFAAQLTGFYTVYGEQHRKPVAIPETAALYAPCEDGRPGLELDIKRAWWRQLFDAKVPTRFPRLKMLVWFEHRKCEKGAGNRFVDWTATTSQSIQSGYRADLPKWARWAAAVPRCRPDGSHESWSPEGSDGHGFAAWTRSLTNDNDDSQHAMSWVRDEPIPASAPATAVSPFVLPRSGTSRSGQVREAPWAAELESLTTDEVRWAQSTLNRVMSSGLAVDGIYGPLTRAAVMTFQRREGLVVDGIVGPITTAALQRMAGGGTYVPAPPAGSPGSPSASVGSFDGKLVASWLIPYLTWAREHGWTGTVNSGYRSPDASEAICLGPPPDGCGAPTCKGPILCAGRGSNHSGDVKPRGAIDVSEHIRFGELMATCPFSPRIKNDMPTDPEHFSETGH